MESPCFAARCGIRRVRNHDMVFSGMKTQNKMNQLWYGIGLMALVAGTVQAQVPPNIEAELRKIGQIVDPPCTAKLYRPLMPANDINSTATPLYPGITIARDVSFGPNPKDVVDIFTADKGGEIAPGADVRRRRRGQQDRAAGSRSERVLRQHHALGHEERHGRRQHAAPSRPGLGRAAAKTFRS